MSEPTKQDEAMFELFEHFVDEHGTVLKNEKLLEIIQKVNTEIKNESN